MRIYSLEFDGLDRYAIYPNHFSTRRYPPIPVWKKRFFDPTAFTTRKLKQCLSVSAEADRRLISGNHRRPGQSVDTSGALSPGQCLTEPFETLDIWKQKPLLFLSLASIGLFVWLSAQTLQEIETGSAVATSTAPQKSSGISIAGWQFPTLEVKPGAANLMSAIDPAKLDTGAIFGSGKRQTTAPDSREMTLPGVGQSILRRLKPGATFPAGRRVGEQFLLPVAGYPLTSRFGNRIHPIFGDVRMHTGIDFGTPSGTPVRAAASGVVSFVGWEGGYGNLVVIRHAHGYETLYAHLDELKVTAGDRVTQGKVIALSGSTGYVTGPHLHFEIRQNQVALNPMNYFVRFANRLGVL